MKKKLAIALAALFLSTACGAQAADSKLNMVVDAKWLAAHLADPDLVVLHVGPKEEYAAAHVPGARRVVLKDIAPDSGELTMQLPDAAELKKRLGALGIGDASRVVVVFAQDWISEATRVVFTLQAAGLGEQTALLDGGLAEWRSQLQATSAQVPAPASLAGPALRMQPVVVDAAFVRNHARSPGYTLVDARVPVFYDGVQPSGDMRKMRKGHIPGAVNVPFNQVTGLDKKLKTPAQLEALFRDSGVKAGTRLIVYCHIGQQATAVIFAARSLGIDAVLYDGSFEDWTFNDGPVEARAGR